MGYPINSADNDIYFVLSGDGSHGYYASSKDEGVGEKDIYMITMPPREDRDALIEKMQAMNLEVPEITTTPTPVIPVQTATTAAAAVVPVTIKGVLKDAVTGTPIQAPVQLTNANGELVSEFKVGPDGMYSFVVKDVAASNYTLSAEKEGYGFVNKTFSAPAMAANKQEITQNLVLKKLEVGNVYVLRNIFTCLAEIESYYEDRNFRTYR
jgi:hypothetical protein